MGIQKEPFSPEAMGEQLKKLRKTTGFSQEKFAESIGLSKDTVYNYEKGKTAIPHDIVKRLCQKFNVSADYFYFEEDKPLVDTVENVSDKFRKELEQCTELEKQQLLVMLQAIRMKTVA